MCKIDSIPPALTMSNVSRASRSSFAKYDDEEQCQESRDSSWTTVLAGMVTAAAVLAFSVVLPHWLAPETAQDTYHHAGYDYDVALSHFDNSPWTYVTDYQLATIMVLLAWKLPVANQPKSDLAAHSQGLLLCYAVSVAAGGLAHQFYTNLEERNSLSFRLLWTLCIGTVTFASGFMGMIGSALAKQDVDLPYLPVVPKSYWISYASCLTLWCAAGGMSHQRPACDTFIAGITQSPSTFYVMAILARGLLTQGIPLVTRLQGMIGFIFNAPLLPLYPFLLHHTTWSLATVNTFLHAWLLVAWGNQGWCLATVERLLRAAQQPPPSAVPLKRD